MYYNNDITFSSVYILNFIEYELNSTTTTTLPLITRQRRSMSKENIFHHFFGEGSTISFLSSSTAASQRVRQYMTLALMDEKATNLISKPLLVNFQ